jgi:hypothetical protein
MARVRSDNVTRLESYAKLALLAARLTATLETPDSSLSAPSTWETHPAQVMPCTGKLRDLMLVVILIPFYKTTSDIR